jgi:hypothetical protein
LGVKKMDTKNTLSEEELEEFYRLKHYLYIFANKKINILDYTKDWQNLKQNDPEKMFKLSEYVFKKNTSIIDEYIKNNPDKLNENELEIVSSWKNAIVCDKAILFKHTKENSLFLTEDKVYGVVGLMDSFREMFHGHTPIFLDIILLPFKNKLVHEGQIITYNLSFGRGMSSGITAEAEEIMLKKGIITDLTKKEKNVTSDEDLLKFYMKSEKNQDKFFYKIEELKDKTPKLRTLYNNELGRINSRHIKKELKNQNIKGHFGVLISQVVASGSTKKELMNNLSTIIPDKRIEEVYIIKI